ncbi:MAG: nitroreductase family protein [Dehalococcoidia bacterium]
MNRSASYDQLLKIIKGRRTVRRFKSDPVPDEYISKIIEAARWAPSGFHTQPWEFVVIRDKEVKTKIINALEKHGPPIKNARPDPTNRHQDEPDYKDAPVYILALCDWRARAGLPPRARDNEAAVANLFCSSMANAFLYMHLAAASLGLASQWYTATSRTGAEKEIRDIIGIPEPLKVYDMMVVGYAYSQPIPKIVRDLDDMVHYDSCGVNDFRTDDEVEAYARITNDWCMKAH